MSRAYRRLDVTRIHDTAEQLARRVAERFPGSGLAAVARELVALTDENARVSDAIARPHFALRAAAGIAIALLLAVLAAAASQLDWRMQDVGATDLLQGIESAVNDAIFVAVAIWFLAGWERRVKRGWALRALHSLRSMTHIIDMHQLTKDPERLLHPEPDTASSPERSMTPFELGRYLDYCSELLSVIGKNAALFAQDFQDPTTLVAVNDVELLTSSLSQKVWQKLGVLERVVAGAEAGSRRRATSTPPRRSPAGPAAGTGDRSPR